MDDELNKEPWSPNPKVILAGAKSLVANGRTYYKAESVSNLRHKWLLRLQVQLAYGRTVEQVFATQKEVHALLNDKKMADAIVRNHDCMKGIASIADDRIEPAMAITLLFWNYQDEDVKDMSDELMAEKVADMEAEGIDMTFFFDQALSSIAGWLSAWRSFNAGTATALSNGSAPSSEEPQSKSQSSASNV